MPYAALRLSPNTTIVRACAAAHSTTNMSAALRARTMESRRNGAIISATNLGKRVTTAEGPLDILSGVNLEIKAGESVAIIGVSGSGKSTLLGLLAGLDVPSEGEIMLAGERLGSLDEDGRARVRAGRVGFVFQSFQLLPALTALENVMLPMELAGVVDAEREAQALLARVGLSERVMHYPRQLSGGEQQRVA